MSKDSDSENERLAREWMASEHWGGWHRGMVRTDGKLILEVSNNDYGQEVRVEGYGWVDAYDTDIPDLGHPGTRAFLLEDVRRAWGTESYVDTFALHKRASCIRVLAPNRPNFKTMDHETEQAALIAALRAAPDKTK